MKLEWYRSGMRSVVPCLLVVFCAGIFGMVATSGETAATSKINFVAQNAIATAPMASSTNFKSRIATSHWML